MVKYLAIAAALVASLTIADQAQARGRRGCSSCGGCSGGSCSAPVAPGKYSSLDNAPPGLATAPAVAPASVATTQPATNNNYYNAGTQRRGLFGRR